MSRWRDISTYRPGVDPEVVSVLDNDGFMVSTVWTANGWLNYDHLTITHWQPLPPLPGEEGPLLEWTRHPDQAVAAIGGKHAFAWSDGGLVLQGEELGELEFETESQTAAQDLAQGIADLLWRASK